MAKKILTKHIDKTRYPGYLEKAQEFFEAMGHNLVEGRYAAAASAGVHCAILAADACCIFITGGKCSSQRHLDLVPLIERLSLPQAAEAAKHLEQVLDIKSYVEYTGDSYSAKEAKQVQKHVERFFHWVRSALPKHAS